MDCQVEKLNTTESKKSNKTKEEKLKKMKEASWFLWTFWSSKWRVWFLRHRCFFFGGGFVREIKFMEVHLHSVMGWFIGFKDSRSYQWESCLVDLDFRFVDLGLEGVGGSKSWLLRGGGKWWFLFQVVSATFQKDFANTVAEDSGGNEHTSASLHAYQASLFGFTGWVAAS